MVRCRRRRDRDDHARLTAQPQRAVAPTRRRAGRATRRDRVDVGVRVIVLTHAGPAFCAGADLKERAGGTPDSTPMVHALERLMDADQPTVAAVGGAVRAGGIGLMASCDLVVVHRSVTFALTEVRIGVAPAIISVPILRRVAPSRIAAAMLTGEPFDAAEAHAMGLVTHVTDDVMATTPTLSAGILAGAPGAVAETKRMLRRVPSLDRRRRSARCGPCPTSCSAAPTPPRAWPRSPRSARHSGMRRGRPSHPTPPNCLLQIARGAISSRQVGNVRVRTG